MEPAIAELFKDRAVRWWLAAQVVGIAGWLAVIFGLAWAGADVLIVAVAGLLLALAAGFLFDPRRPWWGAGPTAVLTEPAARRRYQLVMTVWLLAAVGLMLVLPLVIAGTMIVLEPALTPEQYVQQYGGDIGDYRRLAALTDCNEIANEGARGANNYEDTGEVKWTGYQRATDQRWDELHCRYEDLSPDE